MSENQLKENLVSLRKKKNITQKQLAEEINYSDKVISKWERGESYPDIPALKKLSSFFNVSIDDIVGYHSQDDPKSNQEPSRLNVTKTEYPSFIKKYWIILLVIPLVYSISYGPIVFGLSLLAFSIILIIYTFTVTRYVFEATYKGKNIKLINTTNTLELFIDNELVDRSYGIIAFNPVLIGKIDDKTIRVKFLNLLYFKCEMFIN